MNGIVQIYTEINRIQKGIFNGDIMLGGSAMIEEQREKQPADILKAIIKDIGDVSLLDPKNKDDLKILKNALKELRLFKKSFGVKELNEPIRELSAYINPKTPYTFTIYIDVGGESSVEYPITERERVKIELAQENGDNFEDVDGLSGLYKRVMKAARQKIAEDLEEGNENDYDPDELEYCLGF